MFMVLIEVLYEEDNFKKIIINSIWAYMKRIYSSASTILSRLAGKPFKGLGLVLNQTTFNWLKRLKKCYI